MSIATTWGTTAEDRARAYPCDDLVPGAQSAYFRGAKVDAPADIVFRWLCQLRAAPYSYDWIDNFGRASPRQLTPGLDDLRPSQPVMRIFDLVSFKRGEHLTIMLRSGRSTALFGRVAVSYVVVPAAGDATVKLVAKLIVRHPRPPWGWITRLLLPWGDLVMMRKQLLNLKRRAERDARAG